MMSRIGLLIVPGMVRHPYVPRPGMVRMVVWSVPGMDFPGGVWCSMSVDVDVILIVIP